MTLMNTRPELNAVTHFIINGESGVRLADGYRRQNRCFAASTSIWNRM